MEYYEIPELLSSIALTESEARWAVYCNRNPHSQQSRVLGRGERTDNTQLSFPLLLCLQFNKRNHNELIQSWHESS